VTLTSDVCDLKQQAKAEIWEQS